MHGAVATPTSIEGCQPPSIPRVVLCSRGSSNASNRCQPVAEGPRTSPSGTKSAKAVHAFASCRDLVWSSLITAQIHFQDPMPATKVTLHALQHRH